MTKQEIIKAYKVSNKKPSKKKYREYLQELYIDGRITKNQYNSYAKPILFSGYAKMLKEIYN